MLHRARTELLVRLLCNTFLLLFGFYLINLPFTVPMFSSCAIWFNSPAPAEKNEQRKLPPSCFTQMVGLSVLSHTNEGRFCNSEIRRPPNRAFSGPLCLST